LWPKEVADRDVVKHRERFFEDEEDDKSERDDRYRSKREEDRAIPTFLDEFNRSAPAGIGEWPDVNQPIVFLPQPLSHPCAS